MTITLSSGEMVRPPFRAVDVKKRVHWSIPSTGSMANSLRNSSSTVSYMKHVSTDMYNHKLGQNQVQHWPKGVEYPLIILVSTMYF